MKPDPDRILNSIRNREQKRQHCYHVCLIREKPWPRGWKGKWRCTLCNRLVKVKLEAK